MTSSVILFDLGGVLLPFIQDRRVRAVAQALAIDEAQARAVLSPARFHRLDVGAADESEFATAFSQVAGRQVDAAEARALILSVFEAPNAAPWTLAGALAERFTVGGFSDNPAFVREVFPPGARLEPMFFSADLGLTKPSAEAFQAVQARLGVSPEAILFIDDGLANIDQARRMGWDGVRFASNDQLVADLEARGIL